MPPHVLILTASVGEGHDAPMRTLSAQLRQECPGVEISVVDGLTVMNRSVRVTSESAARIVFFRGEWLWDLGYAVFARFGPTRRLSQKALELAGSGGLSRLVDEHRPDVVVSVFPQTTEVLGRLRERGRLAAPVCACVTDLGGLWYWATPGADVHLVTHPESITEVRRIAGAAADVRCVHGFTDPAFLEQRSAAAARRSLGLPPSGKVVVVSGGGWGVGRVAEAIDTALGRRGRRGRRARRLALREEREPPQRAARTLRSATAYQDRRLHRADGRLARSGRRPRPLDGRAHDPGSADERLPGDLLRLGPRARTRPQRGVPSLRARPRRGLRRGARDALREALDEPRVKHFDFASLPSVVLDLAGQRTPAGRPEIVIAGG